MQSVLILNAFRSWQRLARPFRTASSPASFPTDKTVNSSDCAMQLLCALVTSQNVVEMVLPAYTCASSGYPMPPQNPIDPDDKADSGNVASNKKTVKSDPGGITPSFRSEEPQERGRDLT